MLKKLLKQRSKKGFTLIELIVVLVILAILAAAAIPTMMGYVDKARKSQYLANCRAVYVAGQASVTEQLGKGAVTIAGNGATIEAAIPEMVPDIERVKVQADETLTSIAADTYVAVLDVTDAKNPRITKVIYCQEAATAYVTLTPGVGDGNADILD